MKAKKGNRSLGGAILLMAALLTLAMMAGCSEKPAPGSEAAEATFTALPAEQPTPEATTAAVATTAPDEATTVSPTTAPSDEETAAADKPEVIAESSNTVSDKEKQQILDELTDELSGTLGSLDNLDDPDASDLTADSIE